MYHRLVSSVRKSLYNKLWYQFLKMTERKEFKKLPGLLGSIKLEPGTSTLPPGRLPSFRGARDLTLGALGAGKIGLGNDSKSRKVYTPNVNVQRNKTKESVLVKEDHPRNRDVKRGRGRGDWKPGRGRAASNFIQSTGGVFAEGIAPTDRRRENIGGGYGGDRDTGSSFIPKPKLNLQHERKFDREEEEQKLRELLRDDFLDDPTMDPDMSNRPVELPLLKTETPVKKELKKEMKPVKEEIVLGGVKIKQEKEDEEMLNTDVKVKIEKEENINREEEDEELLEVAVADLLKNKHPQLLFLQLPDCMPGLRMEAEPAPNQLSSSSKQTAPTTTASADSVASQHCTLSMLSEGCIGKFQILRSGNARLILGNTVLHVSMGTQVGFRQDLISVNLDLSSRSGDMINLGAVQTRLSCSPDWETMLKRPRA